MLRNLLLSAGLLFMLSVPSALAADVTGSWDVKIISTSDGEVHGVAGFTQNGNHVTGWLGPSETDPIPITLDLRENKLTIWTHPRPGRERCLRPMRRYRGRRQDERYHRYQQRHNRIYSNLACAAASREVQVREADLSNSNVP